MNNKYDYLNAAVGRALAEDVGAGDVTARLLPEAATLRARVIARESAIVCGQDWFTEVFRQAAPSVSIDWLVADGDAVKTDTDVCTLGGLARELLTGERTALNFLQTLSGVATLTAECVAAVSGTRCRVLDTRKTVPGLRHAQKYAVRCGGGTNHRMGLYDAILIKENHIAAAGGIAEAIHAARKAAPGMPVEIEVESIAGLKEALSAEPERVMLDNFTTSQLAEAVSVANDKTELEASGGFTLDDLAAVAATGVDFVSIGALTKHVRATDYSMRFLDE